MGDTIRTKDKPREGQMTSSNVTSIETVQPNNTLKVTQEQLTLARTTIAKDLDENQFALFCYNCQRMGIHPLDGLLVPVVRNDNGEKRLTFVTTVDLLRSRAADSGEYAGSDDVVFQYGDEKMPCEATTTVWRFVQGSKAAFTATARWDEYYPGDKQGFMWRNKPHVMLGKCAEALALRKGFPKQLAGLYIPEELQREVPTQASRSQAKRQAKPAPQPVGNVVCGSCGQMNSHTPDCKFAAQAGKCPHCHAEGGHLPSCPSRKAPGNAPETANAGQTQAPTAQTPTETKEAPKKTLESHALLLQSFEDITGPRSFTRFDITDKDGFEWQLYCFHKSLAEKLKKYGMKKVCLLELEKRPKDGRDFYGVEHILEIQGVGVFVNDEPPLPQE